MCCVTDDGGDRQLLRQAGQFPLISRYELRALDQIEWQIAAQAQLGKDSQIGPALLGELGQFQDLGGIPGEVADGGIELCERNLHGRLIEYGARLRIAMSRRQFGCKARP